MRLVILAWSCLVVAAGCGAKTGLRVPDAEFDPPVDATLADVCVAREQPVERFAAQAIFAIDRSGSMAERVPSGVTRWAALTGALESVLPAVDRELWTGLIQFPLSPDPTGTMCGAPMSVELSPRAQHATELLAALRATRPAGGTPTFDVISAARAWYDAHPALGRIRGRYIVLATDGAPNCNPALSSPCACTNPVGCGGLRGRLSCLDEDRTVARVAEVLRAGYPTFVIGIPGRDEALEATLDRMAIAGGRARPEALGGPRYYRAEDATELRGALRSITEELVRCRFVTEPLDDPERVLVLINGRVFAHDPTHADGWDWEHSARGEFTLYGAACDEAQRAMRVVRVVVPCP